MKTVCLCISKEVEDSVQLKDLETLLPSMNKAIKDEGWIIDDLQIL